MEAEVKGEVAAALVPPETVKTEVFTPTPIQMKDLIEAGLHFGHQTRRWNPKMRSYIYGARGGVHIIDLQQTVKLLRRAYGFVVETVARGGHILFVGTKRQAQEIVVRESERAQMFCVAYRWIGGLLTNFRTICYSLDRLKELTSQFSEEDGFSSLKKKEMLRLRKEKQRLEKYFGGLRTMRQLPSALFIVDPAYEETAVREAKKMQIPVVALIDTNGDPAPISYPIPGNDDAMRSIQYVTAKIADACIEGLHKRMETIGHYGLQPGEAAAGGAAGHDRDKYGDRERDEERAGPTVEYTYRRK